MCSEPRAGLVDRAVGKGSPVRVARHWQRDKELPGPVSRANTAS